jgi:beta-glucosidase-like glycosyl hydrolase
MIAHFMSCYAQLMGLNALNGTIVGDWPLMKVVHQFAGREALDLTNELINAGADVNLIHANTSKTVLSAALEQ